MKKGIFLVLFILLSTSGVFALGEKMTVSPTQESFSSGKEISVIILLLDSENNPIQTTVNLTVESIDKTKKLSFEVPTNTPYNFDLTGKEVAGYWILTSYYLDLIPSTARFLLEPNSLISLSIEKDVLVVKNTGNMPYTNDLKLLIGNTEGIQKTNIPIGGELRLRLIAPDGTYNIRVTDYPQGNNSLIRSSVQLTGNAIGVLDERINLGPLTGINPGDEADNQVYNFANTIGSFGYLFIAVALLIGALIALTLERRYSNQLRPI
ncbi:MAG: hypothetical protein AABX11_04090 [Nanoarchaeota archaeon]